ncbi:hypothetical protein JCM10207_000518 [Rhodosporidiobolus poonsookiae]
MRAGQRVASPRAERMLHAPQVQPSRSSRHLASNNSSLSYPSRDARIYTSAPDSYDGPRTLLYKSRVARGLPFHDPGDDFDRNGGVIPTPKVFEVDKHEWPAEGSDPFESHPHWRRLKDEEDEAEMHQREAHARAVTQAYGRETHEQPFRFNAPVAGLTRGQTPSQRVPPLRATASVFVPGSRAHPLGEHRALAPELQRADEEDRRWRLYDQQPEVPDDAWRWQARPPRPPGAPPPRPLPLYVDSSSSSSFGSHHAASDSGSSHSRSRSPSR